MNTAVPPRPSAVRVWTLAARPKTLGAAVAPVLVGAAVAAWADVFHAGAALAAAVSATLIQVGTNFANDYQDFLKGADTEARVGPLRVTQAGWVTPAAVKRATVLAFAAAFVVGFYLVWRGGWPILAIGLTGIACGALYTGGPRSLAYLGIADLFVLVYFGPVAVAGTVWAQHPAPDAPLALAALAGLGPGLLATAILLANNLRDAEADRVANKRTLVVRFGRPFGRGLYALCVAGAALVPPALVAQGAPVGVMLALPALLLFREPMRTLRRETAAAALAPVLPQTARNVVAYSALLALGWLLG